MTEKTKKKPVRKVKINVVELVENTRVEKGFFGDRLRGGIDAYFNIDFQPGIPLIGGGSGTKKSIGYIFHAKNSEMPLREPREIEGNLFRVSLKQNDHFRAIMYDLAEVLVRSQGKTYMEHLIETPHVKPQLSLTYESPEFEEKLKRI